MPDVTLLRTQPDISRYIRPDKGWASSDRLRHLGQTSICKSNLYPISIYDIIPKRALNDLLLIFVANSFFIVSFI